MNLINSYQIVDYSAWGVPFVDVKGAGFDYEDLYKLIGRQRFSTTFTLKNGSDSFNRYGELVTGVIHYSAKELKELVATNGNTKPLAIKVDCSIDLSQEQKAQLKYYNGINISDIECISFFLKEREIEGHDSGEKKVPNIIKIETDCSGIDPHVLRKSYLASKNNDGVELIAFEKEQLIGITLGINNGHIDSRVLKHFGFTLDSVKENKNVWNYVYKVKEYRETLSAEEKKKYSDLKEVMRLQALIKVFEELKKANISGTELGDSKEALREIIKSADSFSPSILLHGDKQVYWDLDSYLHIAMRHLKDYQIGKFKEKTPLPYKSGDLKLLIEQVIGSVKEEYQSHRKEKPNAIFARQGAMAIAYNGDHYNLRINPNGCVVQFHTLG
jgi:hypothetical protein